MIKIGIFSGRFDPPNSGHLLTIERLFQEYHLLLVPILDYPDRKGCTAEEAKKIFEHHFGMILPPMFRNTVRFVINDIHFAKISLGEYYELLNNNDIDYRFATYLAGNQEVLDHMKDIGVNCEFVPRVTIEGIDQYLFESTKIRKEMSEENKSLDDIYNIKIKG